jgi:hypothetical protein
MKTFEKKTQHCQRPRPTWWGTAVVPASPSCRRCEVDGGTGAHAHASPGTGTGLPYLPFCDGQGGWGTTLDDGAAQARGVAREGPGASQEGATQEGLATRERCQSRHFMLGEGAGKRERPAARPCGNERGCGAVRGLEQLRRTPQPEWRIFLF